MMNLSSEIGEIFKLEQRRLPRPIAKKYSNKPKQDVSPLTIMERVARAKMSVNGS